MVVALLENLEIHIWLLSCRNIKSPDMVDVLLEHKKSSYGCSLAGKFRNLDMVDVTPVGSRSDPIGGSELKFGARTIYTIYWDSH